MDPLERASLLEELSGVLAATAAGGRVVLLAGEAGIGKSALVKRFTERQSADARFLLGACDPLLTPRALGPLHDISRQTGGRLAELLASGGPREAVFAAFLDQLAQPPRRRVVVVEDAHWADEATLDLLVFLGRRLERTPVLLIVTYRDDELGGDHPLRGVLGALPQGMVHPVRPQPLSEAAVAELARRAGRPAAGLRALTGGNPLLVTEVLAAGDAGVPMTVRHLVLARLAGLPADAQEVVRLVAVVPTRAELWLLEEALGPEPAAVERCVAAGLLVVGEEAVGFRHELVRQAVEGSLSTLGRRELNRRVLRVLSEAQGRGWISPGWCTTPGRPTTPRRCCVRTRRRPAGGGGLGPPGGRRALPGGAAHPGGGRRQLGVARREPAVAVAPVVVGWPPGGGGGGRRPRHRRARG